MIRERIGHIELELETHPGLFSPSKVDTGTRALISCIELAGNDKVLDLGCGYGVVGIWAARRIGAAKVWMLDNDPVAIELANRNAKRNGVDGVAIIASDAFESLSEAGFTMILCIAVCGYTCYIALSRLDSAPPAMYSAVVAAGTAILAARAVDLVMPDPRINRQVTRGAFGIVIGTMCGTASAAYAGLVIEGPEPRHAAIGGLLQVEQIKDLVAEGVTTYDMGMDMPYKHRWADGTLDTVTLAVLRGE